MYERRNWYYRGSKISEKQFLIVFDSFCDDELATIAARRSGLSIRSTNSIYIKLRNRMVKLLQNSDDVFNGSRKNMREALEFRGYNCDISNISNDNPIFMETIRCCSGGLSDRISSRGLRADSILIHSIELYIRAKSSLWQAIEFVTNDQNYYDKDIINIVNYAQNGNLSMIRRFINDVKPPNIISSWNAGFGMRKELLEDLSNNPI